MRSVQMSACPFDSNQLLDRHCIDLLTLFRLGFLRVAQLGGGGGVPAAYNSKTINDNEMKLCGVVKDHQLINLVLFNWDMTSSLRHNDVITVKILDFHKNFTSQRRKVYRRF